MKLNKAILKHPSFWSGILIAFAPLFPVLHEWLQSDPKNIEHVMHVIGLLTFGVGAFTKSAIDQADKAE